MSRELLYRADRVRAMIDVARNVVAAEYRDELAAMRREVDELRESVLLVLSLERQRTASEVAELRRELEAALVRLARRNSRQPLH